MTAQNRATLYTYFLTGDKPTQQQFANFIDSNLNLVTTSGQSILSDVSALGTLDVTGNFTVKSSALANLTGNLTVTGGSVLGGSTGGNQGAGTLNAVGLYVGGVAVSTAAPSPILPQGRLTLTSNTPVMSTDATAQTTIYYTPYIGANVPVYSGSIWANNNFSQLSLALDSNSGHTNYHQSGKLFDCFIFNNSGTITLGTGPAWSSSTARGSGAGSTQISLLNGVWVNTVSITLRTGNASGNTVVVGINQATYVGTMYATANGQTGMAFKPNGAAGGSANILGLYNAYNRIRTYALERDSTSTWTYATTGWRNADNNANNSVNFVDGLQQSFIDTTYECAVSNSNIGTIIYIGANLDSTSATPNIIAFYQENVATQSLSIISKESFYPQLGLHYIQAMENTTSNTATFSGDGFQTLIVSLDM